LETTLAGKRPASADDAVGRRVEFAYWLIGFGVGAFFFFFFAAGLAAGAPSAAGGFLQAPVPSIATLALRASHSLT
jgi:hypothetical protein